MRTVILLFALIAFGCTPKINQETTNYEGEQILVGEVNWDGLTKAPYDAWFTPNYLAYQVDEASLSLIEPTIHDVEIVVFLGTWCEDSHVQIPQFYKMLDHMGYDISLLKVVALEKLETAELVSPQHEEQAYNITHVPTFIFMRDGQELGRIVEYPKRTIEEDMVDILMQ